MKTHVSVKDGRIFGDTIAHLLDSDADLSNFVLGGALGSESGEILLDDGSCLHDVLEFGVIGAGESPEEGTRQKFGASADKGSVADATIDHADEFHRFERLTQGSTCDAELLT